MSDPLSFKKFLWHLQTEEQTSFWGGSNGRKEEKQHFVLFSTEYSHIQHIPYLNIMLLLHN